MKKLSEIGGRMGNSSLTDASKIGLKIAKILFTTEILNDYTWTGKSNTKKRFLQFKRIPELFFDVIKLACADYNRNINEHFFKYNLLKHAKLRLIRSGVEE